jgi:hypothetical protein
MSTVPVAYPTLAVQHNSVKADINIQVPNMHALSTFKQLMRDDTTLKPVFKNGKYHIEMQIIYAPETNDCK